MLLTGKHIGGRAFKKFPLEKFEGYELSDVGLSVIEDLKEEVKQS